MRTFLIEPYVGVDPVRLGMSRADVHRVMPAGVESYRKVPFDTHDTDAWYGGLFQVAYGGVAPTVEFIQLAADAGSRIEYAGLDVFATPAEDLVRSIAALSPFDPADPELGYSYVFPSLELSLWRPVREDRFFSAIGIGVRGYFSGSANGKD